MGFERAQIRSAPECQESDTKGDVGDELVALHAVDVVLCTVTLASFEVVLSRMAPQAEKREAADPNHAERGQTEDRREIAVVTHWSRRGAEVDGDAAILLALIDS